MRNFEINFVEIPVISPILVNYVKYIQIYRLYQILCHLSNVNKTQPILKQPSTLPQFEMSKKRCYHKSNRFMHGFILIGVIYHPLVLFVCSISNVSERNVFFKKESNAIFVYFKLYEPIKQKNRWIKHFLVNLIILYH